MRTNPFFFARFHRVGRSGSERSLSSPRSICVSRILGENSPYDGRRLHCSNAPSPRRLPGRGLDSCLYRPPLGLGSHPPLRGEFSHARLRFMGLCACPLRLRRRATHRLEAHHLTAPRFMKPPCRCRKPSVSTPPWSSRASASFAYAAFAGATAFRPANPAPSPPPHSRFPQPPGALPPASGSRSSGKSGVPRRETQP